MKKKKNDKSLNRMIAEIENCWNGEENFVDFMPYREMYDESSDICEEGCIHLDSNPDWMLWELELME